MSCSWRVWDRTADAEPAEDIRLVRTAMLVAAAVEGLADLDTATHQVGTGSLDVRDDQVQSLRGAGHCGGDVLAEDDRRG
jgi:hypothetical protein